MGEDADLLRKVSGLLAKAEGTDNENEAKAFFEKAHELMLKYSIDEQRVRMARKAAGDAKIETPVVEDYMFATYDHHAKAKIELLEQLAKAHHVKFWAYPGKRGDNTHRPGNQGLFSQWCKLVGYKGDIEAVKILYISLLIQGSKFASDDWRREHGDAKAGRFGYITGHIYGFAVRIGERFRELDRQMGESAADSKALMRSIDEEVDHWYRTVVQGMKVYCLQDNERRTRYCTLEKYHEEGHNWAGIYRCHAYADSAELKRLRVKGMGRNGAFCYLPKGHKEDAGTEHDYSVKAGGSSGYVATGRERQVDSAGYSAGKAAANRADIGLTRVGSNAARIGN